MKKRSMSGGGRTADEPLPESIAPQLATLARRPPASGDWLYEIKFDGYRLMCRVEQGTAKLITRGGHDWTEKMRTLATAIDGLPVENAWLDGEVVVLTESGVPDFQRTTECV
ncbi:ATP dependent DNA ligase [Caballeronia arationis]|nr:ATP dependent DNA ligase [Caballeronia arationis]